MPTLRSLLAPLLALGIAGCAGAPMARPHRVILISLDGAGALELHDLHRQGLLRAGGFERFFRDGQVADALIPVDPTLTSTNHISLVTGFPPARTGIVSNQFHPAGTPAAQKASGFDAAIGTETLWEAARRQGRRTGVLGWPGADAKGERRIADWGMAYNNFAEFGPQLLTLSRADWSPLAAGPGPAVASHSTPLSARLTVGGEAEGAETRTLELIAVDGTDDGKVNYDAVAARTMAPVRAGRWGLLTWPEPGVSSRVKLLEIAPDLASARLYMDGMYRTLAYPEELAAALTRDGLYWPGPPDNAGLNAGWQGKPGIDLATWTEQAELGVTFMGEALRSAAARADWDLLLGYLPAIDQAGHRLLLLDPRQPTFSPERRDELTRARNRAWEKIDAELAKLISGLDLTRTTLVLVSDHGMMPVHTAVDPNALLAESGAAPERAYAVTDGGVAYIYLEEGGDAASGARILADLASRYADWRIEGEAPVERVLDRREAARLGIDHPNSGDLVLFARKGYLFRQLSGGKSSTPAPVYGTHGYLSTHPEMHGIYMAVGAGIKPHQGGRVHAAEIAPRVAAWLGISPPREKSAP
jgi:predicted AlkP superfamily pyrophosphatase or phosphodiesterase